jgi:hypothetical protein
MVGLYARRLAERGFVALALDFRHLGHQRGTPQTVRFTGANSESRAPSPEPRAPRPEPRAPSPEPRAPKHIAPKSYCPPQAACIG